MRKFMLALVVFVLLAGLHSVNPVTAGPDSGYLIAQADVKAPAEPAKTEEKKEEPKKEEKKEEPKAAGDTGPEKITFENVGKLGVVEFPHKFHGEKNKCDECHGGDKPVFEKKITKAGMKMADMYAGKNCGFCHDGKKVVGTATVFEAKKSCAKCHKKK